MLTILFLQFLLPLLPYLIPAMAGLGSAAMSAGAVNRMNRYNDPRAQLQRLNAAGLPFAAFAQGQSGSQSSLPDTSGIQAGATEAVSNYFINRMQNEQIDMLRNQKRGVIADADIKELQRDILKEEADAALNNGIIDESGFMRSNAFMSKKYDYQMKEYEMFMKRYDKDMKEIDSLFQSENYKNGNMQKKFEAEIDAITLRNRLFRQAFTDARTQTLARNNIIARMEKNGLNFAEALFIVIMNAIGGSAKFGGSHLGF